LCRRRGLKVATVKVNLCRHSGVLDVIALLWRAVLV
jgi:hypothetical protein